MPIDLSAASDDGLSLILLRVPVRDLIGKCTQVSPQWYHVLSESCFWRNKMEFDGYHLDWPKLAGISTKSIQSIALKHCFNRNFINDVWYLDERRLNLDQRWIGHFDYDIVEGGLPRIEIPPVFMDGQPEFPEEFGEPIAACLGLVDINKRIIIRLVDEGLTDEIMDKFRPTIVVTEIVGNRRDCTSNYEMVCSLKSNVDDPVEEERMQIRFGQGQAEGWHRLEHSFKDYPAGMRYVTLRCSGGEGRLDDGLKLANCSVKALLEKNAAE